MFIDMSLYIGIMATLASSLLFILFSFLRIRKLERDVYRYQMRIRNLTKA
jgi:hypothetical protein